MYKLQRIGLLLLVLLASGYSSKAQEADLAKKWLVSTVKVFFEADLPDMREITTERYAEYKQDAISVEYDGMTVEEFKDKWADTYDINYAGFGESFLTGQQDWGEIVMTKCDLVSSSDNDTFIFQTIISDLMFKLDHHIDITVVTSNDGFKIDDVKKKN